MDSYKLLTSKQSYQIYALLKEKHTLTLIAEVVGKHKSSISREVTRNTGCSDHRPIQGAQRLCDQRKQGKYASYFSASDWHLVEHLLSEYQWSPEQISEDGILDISQGRI